MPFIFQTRCYDDVPVPGRMVDIFAPSRITHALSFFFVHGGGWKAGNRSNYHLIMNHLVNLGYVCASVDYRLAGVNAIDQLGDVRAGYHQFIQYLRENNLPTRTLTHGISAGAHLAALFGLARPGDCGEALPPGEPDPAPLAVALEAAPVTFEPWDEIFPQGWASMQQIAGEPYRPGSERYRLLSPIHHLRPDSPRLLLQEAANEHMFPIEESARFVEKAKSLGVKAQMIIYPKAEHGFFYDVTRPAQIKAMQDLLNLAQEVE